MAVQQQVTTTTSSTTTTTTTATTQPAQPERLLKLVRESEGESKRKKSKEGDKANERPMVL